MNRSRKIFLLYTALLFLCGSLPQMRGFLHVARNCPLNVWKEGELYGANFFPFYKHRTVAEKLYTLDSSAKRCIKREAESSSKSVTTRSLKRQQWPVPSKPHASLLVARPQENSWLPRQPGSQPLPLVESRSPIGTGLELLPSVRSGVTRNQLSF